MRLALWSLAAVVAVSVAVVFAAPLFISADDVRDKLFAEIEAATGYRLTVNGSLHISAFPSLKLVVEDVGVAQSSGVGTVDLATAKELRFGLALAPLFSGKVQLTEIALVEPVVTMPEGSSKGESTGKGERTIVRPSMPAALENLSLDSLRIEDGTLILRGQGGGTGKRVEGLNLVASLPAFDAPLSLDLKARVDGNPLGVVGSIANFGPFLDGVASQLEFDIDAPAYVPQKLVVVGSATYTGDVFAVDGVSAKAGDTTLRGVLSANLSGAVPQIKASLNGDSLDVDSMLGGAKSTGGSDGSARGAAREDAGWSDAKIDFSGLKSLNAEVNLSLDKLRYGTIKAGPIGIRASAAGGKLKLELPNFQLYEGVGTGVLSLDASGKVPVQTFRFSLTNLEAYPFLDDAAAFERIEGKAAVAVDLVTSGTSQRAMVAALSGTANFEFSDGAIRGINVAKMVRNLASGTLSGWQSDEAEKTDFASLGGSFKIAQGKAATNDLHLSGPMVRMAGTGTVDLPAQTIKFRVDPQLVASLEGQGGKTDLEGLGVPVAVDGPWAQPAIYPDIAGILENPQAAYAKLSKLGGGLVKLPRGLGNALSNADGIGGLVRGKAGNTIENLIQADQGAGQQGVVRGLGQLLGSAQPGIPATAPADPAQPATEGPAKKKTKKKQAKAVSLAKPAAPAQPAASSAAQPAAVAPAKPAPKQQLIENIFGAF